MSALLAAVRDVLVPPRCAGCGSPGAWFCLSCRDTCETTRIDLGIVVTAVGAYEGPLRDAIHRLKYKGERSLAHELGELLARCVGTEIASGTAIDVLVPVALHSDRRVARGYDQAALLAEVAAERTGLPSHRVVHRMRQSVPQVGLDRSAREANVRGAFVGEAGMLRGLQVALVDDVATTGATLRAAAVAARAAGARDVSAYVLAFDE